MIKKIDENRSNLVLVDANAFIHSSFHAYQALHDTKGNDQRVLRGVIDTLITLAHRLPSIDNVVLVFDPEDGHKYRKTIYPQYKENRPAQNKDLIVQKNNTINIIKNFIGLPVVVFNGYEADDAIGSLARLYSNSYQVIIVSPDKDLAQLVDSNTLLMKKLRGEGNKGYALLNELDVMEEFGVMPLQIPDWLALMGDTVDNLPGIKKIGAKTSAKILNEYKSIEHLLAFSHELENRVLQEQIILHAEQLKIVKHLATIKTDLEIKTQFEDIMSTSSNIRGACNYKSNLNKLCTFFKWSDSYLNIFQY